jgi:hypothetical protein
MTYTRIKHQQRLIMSFKLVFQNYIKFRIINKTFPKKPQSMAKKTLKTWTSKPIGLNLKQKSTRNMVLWIPCNHSYAFRKCTLNKNLFQTLNLNNNSRKNI